jgi:hypothetical protein
MKAIDFPQQNEVIAKDQPEYIPLPAFLNIQQVRFNDGTEGPAVIDLTCCFQLSPEEVAQVIATGKIWYTQVVNNQSMQPIHMSVVNPFKAAHDLTDNWITEMCNRMKEAVDSVNYSGKGKLDIFKFIASYFERAARPCNNAKIIGAFACPPSTTLHDALLDHYDHKRNEIKKCDGNGKR